MNLIQKKKTIIQLYFIPIFKKMSMIWCNIITKNRIKMIHYFETMDKNFVENQSIKQMMKKQKYHLWQH